MEKKLAIAAKRKRSATETQSAEYAITENPTATPAALAHEDQMDSNRESIVRPAKHTQLGIASCVMLVIETPLVAYLALTAFAAGFDPRARAWIWVLLLIAQTVMWMTFVVSWIGLTLGILGMTSFDKSRITAGLGFIFHAIILIGIVSLQVWFQRR